MDTKKRRELLKLLMEEIHELCTELHKVEERDDKYLETRNDLFEGARKEVDEMTDEQLGPAILKAVNMYRAVDNSLFVHKKMEQLKKMAEEGDNPIAGLLKALMSDPEAGAGMGIDLGLGPKGDKKDSSADALDFLSEIKENIQSPKYDGAPIDEDKSDDKGS